MHTPERHEITFKSKIVPVVNRVARHEDVWGRIGVAPRINIGTRWKRVIRLTIRSLYLQGKRPLNSLDRRLSGS